MAYTTINKSSLHHNGLTYAGNGASPRSITGVGFQPDFLWIKNRDGGTAYEHRLMDAVRGSNKVIHSSQNAAENTEEYYTVGSFDSDGWTGRNGTGLPNLRKAYSFNSDLDVGFAIMLQVRRC